MFGLRSNWFLGFFTAQYLLLAVGIGMPGHVPATTDAAEIQLHRAKPDPYGYPRPAPGETDVPVGTSFFFGIGFKDKNVTDIVRPESISVHLRAPGQDPIELLKTGKRFGEGCSGKIAPGGNRGPALIVYLDTQADLQAGTTYTVVLDAKTGEGSTLDAKDRSWQFTTAQSEPRRSLNFQISMSGDPVHWRGGFFTGFCKPTFCTSASNRIPGYELMDRTRQRYPKAWSLQRDISMTGMEHQPRFLLSGSPNVVRELETRRITSIEDDENSVLLSVEDFFGHRQYGIESGRPITPDYQVGDEVLIADGITSATSTILEIVDDTPGSRTLRVAEINVPQSGWALEYSRPLPEQEDPHSPGLFASGGCYLRKLKPPGTPRYFWGRIDKEWDIARRFNRRLVVNFTDAPGDLSVDGRNWTYPKDYIQYHNVVQTYTSHLIERYGDACLDYVWSVFNEPDLAIAFWRSRDWNELQKFYDYSVDAILRAFEDHGYDSDQVVVGGLEIGAIFGTRIENPILKVFLNHCSPTATCEGALPRNAAFADKRLDGRRSRRVEELCRTSKGKGSPCDFISIHSYNSSEVMAAKLKRAKEIALETDPHYYADLWVNSFESCPGWAPPPDVAANDSYLGNGYFPTWCADVVRRQLAQASQDARYAFGETILTFWPWPNHNFRSLNGATRVISVDTDGDGRKDREQTVPMPIMHFLELLTRMGDTFWVLPEQSAGPNVISGFASKQDDAVYVLLYAHNTRDIQSRHNSSFELALELADVAWPRVQVKEYRIDKDNNSYYELGRKLRDRLPGSQRGRSLTEDDTARLAAQLDSGEPSAQLAALNELARARQLPDEIVGIAVQLYQRTKDAEVRAAIERAGQQIFQRHVCYSEEEVQRVQELAALQVTRRSTVEVSSADALRHSVTLAANGVNFLVIQPE